MNSRILNAIIGRLSLRPPQAESLRHLVNALDIAPELLQHERGPNIVLEKLQKQFPSLQDFERDFPSFCFALATGVGKTRLMGAFISYLHLAHGINNFFILAPNLTIYNKLIADFTPNTEKYVFKGISEFAQQAPLIITGDNYDQTGSVIDGNSFNFEQDVRINIFNISKINSEVRGGKEPRIKRMKEVLGDSYFNHLANMSDLVLLMDESHRYRASAGVKSINELNPLFGLELTATPFVEAGIGKITPFKNVIMDYPLALAMDDGFVKEPAVVTQRGFDARNHSPEEIEKIKLEDAVRLHETTKVELATYARENAVKIVKPFMLVIARDTTHASQLLSLIESQIFFEGRYKGKVIQVDSSRSGSDEEEMIKRLLAVESVDEPTEIVIHVNMLKEGWDVTNLYTIVPLRAANARTLIEQSIGRGLRLPYGKRTGVSAVDRLNIIAHDKFQEIIDDANRADSPIRLNQLILEAPSDNDQKLSVEVCSSAMAELGLVETPRMGSSISGLKTNTNVVLPTAQFSTQEELQVARLAIQEISGYESRHDITPTSNFLLKNEVQNEILKQVSNRLAQASDILSIDDNKPDLAAIIAKTTEIYVKRIIDIPCITVIPKGETTTGFHPFKLEVQNLHLQPSDREIVGQMLRTNLQFTLSSENGSKENRLEDYIVHALLDFDDIDYDSHSDLLYDLADQFVKHLLTYLSEAEAHNVLERDKRLIAKEIHAQMVSHFWEKSTSYEIRVSRGFTSLKPCNFTVNSTHSEYHFRETLASTSQIRQVLFGGFERCLYPLQRFDSDTERRFSVILERDAIKWFKPARGQFQIYYKIGSEQPEYLPDFVVESDSAIYMIEIKASKDINSKEVEAKADAATHWCKLASDNAIAVGAKTWKYLLIPHDEIIESNNISYYLRFEIKSSEDK